MLDSGWIDGAALEDILPHRGVNMLIDGVRTTGDSGQCGESLLTISRGDALGRDLFLRKADGSEAVMEHALAEHLALNAINLIKPDMQPGEIAFFSVINSFAVVREPMAGERLLAKALRLRDKGPFKRFDGKILGADGSEVASAEIMAYTADPEATASRDGSKKAEPPKVTRSVPIDKAHFSWKDPRLVFIDEMVDVADDASSAVFRYTYPAAHVFCAGHFPGNPIMMGVTQWMAACDAAGWLARERADDSPLNGFSANAEVIREDGSLICDIKKIVFTGGGDGSPMKVMSTQRVGFRDFVRPGETIFVRVGLSGL